MFILLFTFFGIKTLQLLVITPVFNGGATIADTIQSVLSQETDLEVIYHIQDGGSTDDTVDLARRQLEQLQNKAITAKHVVSETDTGMYDAIYKAYDQYKHLGIDWMTWINADDRFLPGAFQNLFKAAKNPEIDWCASVPTLKREDGSIHIYNVPIPQQIVAAGLCDGTNWQHLMQEGSFWKSGLFEECAEEFRQFRFAGDWFLWFHFARQGHIPYSFSESTGCFFFRSGQISEAAKGDYDLEIANTRKRYKEYRNLESFRDQVLIHAEVSSDIFSNQSKRMHHKISIREFVSPIYEVGTGRYEYLSSQACSFSDELYGPREPSNAMRTALAQSAHLDSNPENLEPGGSMIVRHVLTPMIRREIPDLRRMIAGCPPLSKNASELCWHFAIDDKWATKEMHSLTELINTSNLKPLRIEFHNCQLSPEESVYIRWDPEIDPSPTQCDLEYGLKSGPNLQFFKSMQIVQEYKKEETDAVILVELDNFPIRLNWIDQINGSLKNLPKFLITGMNYKGTTELSESMKNHLNGNAIYGIAHPDFEEFLDKWEKIVRICVMDKPHGGENVAYDVAIDWFLDMAERMMRNIRGLPDEAPLKAYLEVIPTLVQEFTYFMNSFSTMNHLLIHLEGPDEQRHHKEFDIETFFSNYPNACLVHSKSAGKVWGELLLRANSENWYTHPLNQAIEAQRTLRKLGIAPGI